MNSRVSASARSACVGSESNSFGFSFSVGAALICLVPDGIAPLELGPCSLLFFAGVTQLREPLLQVVSQHGLPRRISGCAIVVKACSLGAQIPSIIDGPVASTQPGQGHEIDLLVLGERVDK